MRDMSIRKTRRARRRSWSSPAVRTSISGGFRTAAILPLIIAMLRRAVELWALAEAIRALADLQRSNPHPLLLLLALLLGLALARRTGQ
ncbi:MAG: hypothetical protein RQ897_02995 [Thermoflexus sp.]|nr:hypothetical protein [Thermoflexus sp.]MDT7947298.1 hypothetical protein [Thermoflexus sp.]